MSTEALSGLRDYLFVTLSRTNMLWLAEQLKERANRKEELKPYTVEELHQMVEDGKRQIAEGRSYSTEEVLAYCGHEEIGKRGEVSDALKIKEAYYADKQS